MAHQPPPSQHDQKSEIDELAAVVEKAGQMAATQNHRTLHNPFSDRRYLKKVFLDNGSRLDKALQIMDSMMTWRKSFRPHEISLRDEDLSELARTGIAYVNGKDREGRPVIYCKPANMDKLVNADITHEMKLRLVVLTLERALSRLGPECPDQSFIIVIDLSGRMCLSVSDVQYIRHHLMTILIDCYAERLARCFVLNPPFIFSTIWSLTKRFVDPTTLEKYQFLRGKSEQTRVLLNYISSEQLEQVYGGTNPFQYDFQKALQEDAESSSMWGCPSDLSSVPDFDQDFESDSNWSSVYHASDNHLDIIARDFDDNNDNLSGISLSSSP